MAAQQTPNYGSPFMTWDQVPKQAQVEVGRLAARGQFHPVERLARLAYAWAVPAARQRTWAMWLQGAMTVVGNGPADARREFDDRRQARALVAMGAPNA